MEWWCEGQLRIDLEDALTHLNMARKSHSQDVIAACDELFKGLNRLWNARARWSMAEESSSNDEGDLAQFVELLRSIPEVRQRALLTTSAVNGLAHLEPVLNHWVLSRSRHYRPGAPISGELRDKASGEHREFTDTLVRWQASKGSPRAAVRALTRLAYVVRSNIAHGWKTPHGPDWEQEQRDRAVAGHVYPVGEEIAEAVLGYPRHRLVAYGSLSPGGVNEGVLEHLSGRWERGRVNGNVVDVDGLKMLRVDAPRGSWVDVEMFESDGLSSEWRTLDRFEGARYRRILISVQLEEETITVANAYVRA